MTQVLVHFAAADWGVVALFLVALASLGFSARLRKNSILEFLVAGRALTLPVFVATLVSTWYGGILGVGESVGTYGIGTWLLIGLPYYLFALIYALAFAGKVRRDHELSLPERLESRWGRTAGLVGAGLVLLLAVPAAHVYMLGVLIQCLTGWPVFLCLVVGAVVVTAFLFKGGLLADVRVGVLAFVLMFVGFIAIDIFFVLREPIPHMLGTVHQQKLDSFTGGAGPIGVLSFFILGAWTLVDPGFHQRVTSSASPSVGKKGVLISILCWMVFDLLSITAGLYAMALLPKPPEDLVALFPAIGEAVLPAGLKGLFFVGMTGTVISALAGYTLVSGATVGRELVARILVHPDDEKVTTWSRYGLVVAAILAIVIAAQVHSVVDIWYAYSGAIIGPLLIPVCLAYLDRSPKRLSSNAVCVSMIASFAVSAAWMWQGMRTHNDQMQVSWFGETFSLGTLIPALIVSGAILGVAALARKPATGDV